MRLFARGIRTRLWAAGPDASINEFSTALKH